MLRKFTIQYIVTNVFTDTLTVIEMCRIFSIILVEMTAIAGGFVTNKKKIAAIFIKEYTIYPNKIQTTVPIVSIKEGNNPANTSAA